jgi:signal transduction histidine kinase
MGVSILKDEDHQCLYCNTSDFAFGGIFSESENVENFLEYIRVDARTLEDGQFEQKQNEWRVICEEIETATHNVKEIPRAFLDQLTDVEIEGVDIELDPDHTEIWLESCHYKGVHIDDDFGMALYNIRDNAVDWMREQAAEALR